jgi:uncharacterized membrane protein YjjP (DUF1212 family)
MGNFTNRIIRSAKLDTRLYEEIEADKSAMRQAMLVVVFSGVAAGLGNLSKGGLSGVLLGTIASLAGWYIWAILIYLIGTKLLPEPQTRSDIGELLRTIGFSSSPGLIRVLGVIPGLEGGVFFVVATVWMLAAMVIAVRQALDYTGTLRAVVVCVIGWIVQVLIIMLLFYLFGGLPKPT